MDIAIAGAGLIGRLLGWQLVREGHSVTVYEREPRDESTSSSYVAAAMLAPLSEYPDCDPAIWQMAQMSLGMWRAILKMLNVPHGFDGSIVVAHTQDASLMWKFRRTLERAQLDGVSELSADALADLEPELGDRFTTGLHLAGEGWLDNRVLLSALERECGQIVFESPVNPEQMPGDLNIDCRGKDAKDPDLRGVRGEVIRVYAPEVRLSRPVRLMHPKYQLYVSPRPENVYVIGATQIESAATSPMTVRSALELLSAAYTLHAGFAEAEILELNVGVRPAYPDNLPRVQWHNGVLRVNGLYRHGYLVAPAVVEAAMVEMKAECKYSLTANQ
ncbi:MAG: FAD-dependent oxidoreductase [Gammaproteobacteria bacterium]|nr:FAD-dependent oxidoreductase [Gammaproteobacteria bacterium]